MGIWLVRLFRTLKLSTNLTWCINDIPCYVLLFKRIMKNKADYSKYECPYSYLEKESGHELHGPEGYENTYCVWCDCGFRAPVFYLEPEGLKLKLKEVSPNCA